MQNRQKEIQKTKEVIQYRGRYTEKQRSDSAQSGRYTEKQVSDAVQGRFSERLGFDTVPVQSGIPDKTTYDFIRTAY